MKSNPDELTPAKSAEVAGPADLPRWRRLWNSQQDNLRILAIALVVALFLRIFVAEPRFIPSNSMEPTLHVGDRLLVDKVSPRLHPPHVGDIIVFEPPPQLQEYGYRGDQAFIKRVIATPGETVTVTDHQVIIDGQPLPESYTLEPPDYLMGSITVPPWRFVRHGRQPQRQQRLPRVGYPAGGERHRHRPLPVLAPGARGLGGLTFTRPDG